MPALVLRRSMRMAQSLLIASLILLGSTAPMRALSASSLPSPAAAIDPPHLLTGLKEVSYNPASANGALMWWHWDPSTVSSDFAAMAAAGARTVRINVDVYSFGYPIPSPTIERELSQVVAIAARHGLRTQLCVFDGWGHDGKSSFANIAGSKAWIASILGPYTSDPRIAFIDVKNEIDLESSPAAYPWARALVPYVKALAGAIPVTLSFSGKNAIGGFQTFLNQTSGLPLDFYDYHFYTDWDGQTAYGVLKGARALVAPKPLYVGETGFSTCTCSTVAPAGVPHTTSALEAYQEKYLRTVELAAEQLGLGVATPWQWYDANPNTPNIASQVEFHYGLYRYDGTPKPAAATMASIWAGVPIDQSFNGGFEQAVQGLTGPFPAGWVASTTAGITVMLDTTTAHSGASSLEIGPTTSAPTAYPTVTTDPIDEAISAGQVVTVSAWAKGTGTTGTVKIMVLWADANGVYISNTPSAPLPLGTTEWTKLTAASTAPPNAAYAEIDLQSHNNAGVSWFDDVSMSE